jgi:hypothetical protein
MFLFLLERVITMTILTRQVRYVVSSRVGLCVRPEMPIVVRARTAMRQRRRRILNAAAQTVVVKIAESVPVEAVPVSVVREVLMSGF